MRHTFASPSCEKLRCYDSRAHPACVLLLVKSKQLVDAAFLVIAFGRPTILQKDFTIRVCPSSISRIDFDGVKVNDLGYLEDDD